MFFIVNLYVLLRGDVMSGFYVYNHLFLESECVFFAHMGSNFKFRTNENEYFAKKASNWDAEWISIEDLIGAELIIDNVPVSIFKRATIGTLVFGGLGTVAGLVSGATAKPKSKVRVSLQINDLRVASYTTKCNDIGTAYRLLNTLAQMEKEYYEEHPELKIESKEKESQGNVFSDEITKLKQMLDDGIIDQDEFKEMKKVLIDKSKP